MACSCKNSSNKQITKVKQVVKKPIVASVSKPTKNIVKRAVYKRPI